MVEEIYKYAVKNQTETEDFICNYFSKNYLTENLERIKKRLKRWAMLTLLYCLSAIYCGGGFLIKSRCGKCSKSGDFYLKSLKKASKKLTIKFLFSIIIKHPAHRGVIF